ncbi:FMN-binding glutamate synthase family protein [Paraliomyxa miuraensis]|uniref:FMN-binding glutamate synthase family protein n=1 Tax=Paraliomyxa miuraensis TaxID=376150 RepID=UPI0022529F5D|nr:FMN-binding glutamate synthase family protein [Paraliomyxa miuraensis]MCX4240722.1 FMN-binding glutamate synthase family protein [Paraliomyxa miuraensis]
MELAPIILGALVAFLLVVAIVDRLQTSHSIKRNFPIVGRFRYWFERLGSPLRQYIVTNNDEERPFSRDQRRWIYASAKRENNYFGFGTDNELELTSGYVIIRHSVFPVSAPVAGQPGYDPEYAVPCAKILGGHRKRARAFRPTSIVNTSAMSFGSLSSAAVQAINRGVKLAGALQNTGEGGISDHHRHGGELVWQIGTGYFGCRDDAGKFSLERFIETVASAPVRAIEIKLSQGAKPGLGGVLPASKITPEIARIRLIPLGRDCISPSAHTAFGDVSSMLDFIEQLAEATGLPVGIKSAVGELGFWQELALQIEGSGRAPDFITIDGGEGGTGAAPLVFSDHVSLPFKLGFTSVYRVFAERDVHEKVVFIGSGRLGFPATSLLALGLGCDLVNVAREAMLAIGCIQAQECHTGHCPTGVATQNRWLVGGLDPTSKSARLANYLLSLRKDLLALANACGEHHPSLVDLDRIDLIDGYQRRSAREVFAYQPGWGHPTLAERAELLALMESMRAERASAREAEAGH